MKIARTMGGILLLLCLGISVRWGFSIGLRLPGGPTDFQAYYYGTRCLIERRNPYDVTELKNFYQAEDSKHQWARSAESPAESIQRHNTITMYVNLPATFLLIAPFTLLPLVAAQTLWMILSCSVFFLAALLIWMFAWKYKSTLSTFLIALFLANCELVFSTGNAVGIVIGLCVIAVWCFIEDRFVTVGILCMGISLAIKPHDAGLVWLYFLMAGGLYRKCALQALAVAASLTLPALVWVSLVAPHWFQYWRANMIAIAAPGAVNSPGPISLATFYIGGVINLQTLVSLFWGDPSIYNGITYLICGTMLAAWLLRTIRSGASQADTWLALATIAPITMIVTYHRSYDAKLLLLTVPACAILWSRGGPIRWAAFVITSLGFILTADYPLAILMLWVRNMRIPPTGILAQALTAVQMRPAPLILLVMSVFYLLVYMRWAHRKEGRTFKEMVRTAEYEHADNGTTRLPMTKEATITPTGN